MRSSDFLLRCLLCLSCIASARGLAQEPFLSSWSEVMEEMTTRNRWEDKDWSEEPLLSAYAQGSLLNLNTARQEDLAVFPFLTPEHIENLFAHIHLHGPLKSIYELQLVKGWTKPIIEALLPYVVVEVTDKPASSRLKTIWKDLAKRGGSEVLLHSSFPLHKQKGYERGYLGNPLYQSIRYEYRLDNRLQAGLVAEKDAGEPFATRHNPQGFDHYGFYLLVQTDSFLKTLAIGDYRLHFGLGLAVGNNSLFGKSGYLLSLQTTPHSIKRHRSTDETNYFRGVAATIQPMRGLELSTFYSHRLLDGQRNDEQLHSIYTTGLHRTPTEAKWRNVATLQMAGAHLSYQSNRFGVGTTALCYEANPPYKPLRAVTNAYPTDGNRAYNLAANYRWKLPGWDFQGEASVSNEGWACLNKVQTSAIDGCKFVLLHRLYTPGYRALFAHSFSEGGHIYNENGWYLAGEYKPDARFRCFGAIDFFRFPTAQYRVSKPSQGVETTIQLDYAPSQRLWMYCRYKHENKARNQKLNRESHTVRGIHHNLRYRFQIKPSLHTSLQTTIDFRRFHTSKTKPENGYQITQKLTHRFFSCPLNIGMQATWFHTQTYDTRLYVLEQNSIYQLRFQQVYGKGFRTSLYLSYKPFTGWKFFLKTGQTFYLNRNKIGKGYEEIEGNKRGEIHGGVQAKF